MQLIYLFQNLAATTCAAEKSERLLGLLPKWYKYLPVEDINAAHCEVRVDILPSGGGPLNLQPLLPIGLSIIEMLLAIAGMVAVIYVMYGGYRYLTSQGEPENTKAALSSIVNALIGGVIAITASAIVAFIGNRIGGPSIASAPVGGIDLSPLPGSGANGDSGVVRTIFNIVLAVMGAVSVLIITISGLKFTLSQGDPQRISKAKNSIIYAVAGLVIIIFAATIVNFVFKSL